MKIATQPMISTTQKYDDFFISELLPSSLVLNLTFLMRNPTMMPG